MFFVIREAAFRFLCNLEEMMSGKNSVDLSDDMAGTTEEFDLSNFGEYLAAARKEAAEGNHLQSVYVCQE